MERLARYIVEKRRMVIITFTVIIIIIIFFIPHVKVNYNLSTYLPDEMGTKRVMDVLKKEFSLPGHAQVMVENAAIPEVLKLKRKIEAISGVKNVVWLDDLVDIHQPLEFFNKKTVESYYKDNTALFQVEFVEDDYSLKTGQAVNDIQAIIKGKGVMGGNAVNKKVMRESTVREVLSVSVLVVPIFIIILLLTTRSWFEPIIYLFVIGVSVLINMGTNVIFKDISFITQSSAAILQFAISMDYSLFLLHRFSEERDKGLDVNEAMKAAIIHSFPSLIASCLTTLAGFAALMLMRYRLGQDMSLVLGKGIILSLISVVLLLPGVTILSHRLIERTQHTSLLPSLKKVSKCIIKSRLAVVLIVCLMIIPAYLAQASNSFLYGETSITSGEETESGQQAKKIEEKFGINNQAVLILPKSSIGNELALCEALQGKEYIISLQSLVTIADPFIPQDVLPRKVLEEFTSENYIRMILALDIPVENDITFKAVQDIHNTVNRYYGKDYFLLGPSTSVSDIKEVVDRDFTMVNLISIIAVALIILFTFRSLSLPVLLVLVIETAIWFNMAIPYFMDSSLSFIGFMIVSAVQLGATIDYAILLTNRYMSNRASMDSKASAVNALYDSGWSVITSALILFVAGMGLSLISSIKGISELGLLIGRGAALSGAMVFVVLPQVLVLFDAFVQKTTLKSVNFKKPTV